MSTYVISDIHSCYTKFIKSIPYGLKKLIILGDCFNKCTEQIEMFQWVMENRWNEKYVFVRGNCEVRAWNEILRHFHPEKTDLYFPWFGTHSGYVKNKNISNVIIQLIESHVYDFEEVYDLFVNCFKWYHIEDKWVMAHASWELNKSPFEQDKLNLVYDHLRLLPMLRKVNYVPKVHKIYDGKMFIFGHTPVYSINYKLLTPPVILKNRFYYIDNGIFKRSRPIFYLKIS